MLERCEFPKLPEQYDTALREAVLYALSSFRPVGIVASGTIVRGNPDPASDLDIWVIHFEPARQRIQKFFNGIPTEIFVNPPWVIQSYFESEQASARPIAAHMLATGFVILSLDAVVDELRRRAQFLLTQPPSLTPQTIEQARYEAATNFEDATDLIARDPSAASMLLSHAVIKILRFAFIKSLRFIPRDKDLLNHFASIHPESARRSKAFFETSNLNERLRLATEIADDVLGARGFFEWESVLEIRERPGGEKL
jgi:predicted nucleotidyltransferase